MATPLIGTMRPADEHAFMAVPRESGIGAAARRHWRLIAAVTAAGTLATYLALHALTPVYSAKTAVMIDPREPTQPVIATDPMSFLPPSEEAVRKNEMAIIHSRQIAEDVVDKLQLGDDPEFNPQLRAPSKLHELLARGGDTLRTWLAAVGLIAAAPPKTAATPAQIHEQVVDTLLAHLTTSSPDASRVIEIHFTSPHPARAVQVASAVAEHYLRFKQEQDLGEERAISHSLEGEIDTVNQTIADAQRKLEQTRESRGLPSDTDIKQLADQVSQLTGQLTATEAEKASFQARLAILRAAEASPERLQTLDVVQLSPVIQRLQGEMADATATLNSVSIMYAPTHPKAREARAVLDALRGQMKAESGKLAQSLNTNIAIAEQKRAMLATLVDDAKTRLTKATDGQIQMQMLGREVDANKSLLAQLVARSNETRAQMNRTRADANIISAATMPYAPSFPPTTAMMGLAPVASATAGLLLAMLIERRDSSIRSTAQLRQLTSARVLGAVPAVRRVGRRRGEPVAQLLGERTSIFAENLRAVLLQIDRSRSDKPRTLLVTSSLPQEGKSSVATSLARLLAVSGRQVVIIDADLRSPSVHHEYGLYQSPGLTDLVAGACSLTEALQTDGKSGACVIVAGQPVISPADVLQSPAIPRILATLRERFETVIIDAPPALVAADAGILAGHAELTALVVRWGTTKTVNLVAALQRLQDFDARVGIILTMVDGRRYAQYGDSDIFSRAMRRYTAGA